MPSHPVRLSLLDFGWLAPGQPPASALSTTIQLTQRAESLGFARYWLGEHHVHGHSFSSPHILAAVLAARTSHIRIGIGAMLLQYWPPLRLAEDFILLESLFGRMDLGVGRGRADNLLSHRALLDGRPGLDQMLPEAEYSLRLNDLAAHLRRALPPSHPHHGAALTPEVSCMPELWVCGSATAADQAARIGARFCCTLFHGSVAPPEHVERYRETFRASAEFPRPHAAIAVAGVCAETEHEAVAIRNRFPNRRFLPTVVGSPRQCREIINSFRDRYHTDEIILLDIALAPAERLRSAELVAEACGLRAARADAALA